MRKIHISVDLENRYQKNIRNENMKHHVYQQPNEPMNPIEWTNRPTDRLPPERIKKNRIAYMFEGGLAIIISNGLKILNCS